jgi:hypothetical protein
MYLSESSTHRRYRRPYPGMADARTTCRHVLAVK